MDILAYSLVISLVVISSSRVAFSRVYPTGLTFPNPDAPPYVGKDYRLRLTTNKPLIHGNVFGEGENVTFLCKYDPPNSIIHLSTTYYFISLRVNKIIKADNKFVMDFEKLDETDNGENIKCQARGPLGLLNSNIINLEVLPKKPAVPASKHFENIPFKLVRLPRYELVVKLNGTTEDPGDIMEGSSIIISCNYEPQGEIFRGSSFTIFHNHRKIQYGEKNDIILENINGTFANGLYQCVANSTYGRLQSNAIHLDVKRKPRDFPTEVIPSVIVRSENDHIEEFDNVILNCDVEPNGIIIFECKWFFEGKRLLRYDDPDVEMDGLSLELSRIRKSFEGLFMCQVQTEKSYFYSNPMPLHIATKIYDPKKAKNVLILALQLGESVNPDNIHESDDIYFSCFLTPLVKDIYDLRWTHNDTRLWPNMSNPDIIHGTSTLILKKIAKNSTGTYSCQVHTDEGWIDSNPVEIDVQDKLPTLPNEWKDEYYGIDNNASVLIVRLAKYLKPTRIREHDDVYFICRIPEMITKVVHVDWILNDKQLFQNNTMIVMLKTPVPTLIVLNIKKKYIGEYNCAITTKTGYFFHSREDSMTLNVRDAGINAIPNVHAALGSKIAADQIREFDYVYLTCKVTPDRRDIRKILWFHNNSYIVVLNTGYNLILHNVTKNSSGIYHCEAETEQGDIVPSNPVTITVKDAPKNRNHAARDLLIIAQLIADPEKIYEHDRVFFACFIHPKPQRKESRSDAIYWYHENKQIFDDDKKYTIVEQSLIIADVQRTDLGNYNCVAEIGNRRFTSVPTQLLKLKDINDNRTSPTDWLTVVTELQDDPNNISECQTAHFYCDYQPSSKYIIKDLIYWFRDGWQYNTQNDSRVSVFDQSLQISDLRQSDNGSYHCRIRYDIDDNFYTSEPAHLIINKHKKNGSCTEGIPMIYTTFRSSSQRGNIHETDEVRLFCDIRPRSIKIFDIIWHLNSNELIPNNVTLYDDRSLILRQVGKTNRGNYTCVANSKYGALHGRRAGIFVKDKRNARVELGHNLTLNNITKYDNVYFTCDFTPRTTIVQNIRWFFYGRELLESDKEVEITLRRTKLVIPCIKRNFTGAFTCLAELDDGFRARSNPLTINIKDAPGGKCNRDKPIVIAELLNHPDFIYENETVSFHCYVYPLNFTYNFISWYRNGNELIYTGNKQSGRTLELRDIKKTSVGNYACKISTRKNDFESTPAQLWKIKDVFDDIAAAWEDPGIRTGRLDIPDPGVYVSLLDSNAEYHESDAVFFYCAVKKTEMTFDKIAWFYNTQMISKKLDSNRFTIDGRSLKIKSIWSNMTEKYACQIDTNYGTFKSNPVSLPKIEKIRSRPFRYSPVIYTYTLQYESGRNLTRTPEKIVATNKDKNLVLICFPTSTFSEKMSDFEFSWYRDNRELPEGGPEFGFKYGDQKQTIRFSDNVELRKTLTGTYHCEANTKYGHLASKNGIHFRVGTVHQSNNENHANGANTKLPEPKFYSLTSISVVKVYAELLDPEEVYHENDYVYFYCDFKPPNTIYRNITWFRDTRVISGKNETIIGDRTLRINGISSVPGEKYACQVHTENDIFKSDSTPVPEFTKDEHYEGKYEGPILYTLWYDPEIGSPANLSTVVPTNKDKGLSLVCQSSGLNEKFTNFFKIIWYRNNQTLPANGTKYGLEYGHKNQTLHFSDDIEKRKNLAGTYFCQANTKYGYLYNVNSVQLRFEVEPNSTM